MKWSAPKRIQKKLGKATVVLDDGQKVNLRSLRTTSGSPRMERSRMKIPREVGPQIYFEVGLGGPIMVQDNQPQGRVLRDRNRIQPPRRFAEEL